jgi:RNA polymerase sigma-70 factor (ECF subfamily)
VVEIELRRQAVERAYREHADDVYRVAYAILRDPEAAMDVTQDAFARAFERWEQYDSARPLRHWLHGIAANGALDALRRRKRSAGSGPVQEIAVLDHGGDPATRAANRETIEGCLASLAPLPRAALVLRHYYGYDYEQIGRLLRTSSGNVGSMLSRAHTTLRARLAPEADANAGAEPGATLPLAREATR